LPKKETEKYFIPLCDSCRFGKEETVTLKKPIFANSRLIKTVHHLAYFCDFYMCYKLKLLHSFNLFGEYLETIEGNQIKELLEILPFPMFTVLFISLYGKIMNFDNISGTGFLFFGIVIIITLLFSIQIYYKKRELKFSYFI
jgi:hypothetical protein